MSIYFVILTQISSYHIDPGSSGYCSNSFIIKCHKFREKSESKNIRIISQGLVLSRHAIGEIDDADVN